MSIVSWAQRPQITTRAWPAPAAPRPSAAEGGAGVRRLERTVTLCRNALVEALAGTRWSDLHPDREWIVVDLRLRALTCVPVEVLREEIVLTRSDGWRLALPDRDEIARELSNVGRTLIAASAEPDPLDAYLPSGLAVDRIPFVTRSLLQSVVLEPGRVAAGKLLFRAPRGTRIPAAYVLAVTGSEAPLQIPFVLPAPELSGPERPQG
jgi:hypothetical protein